MIMLNRLNKLNTFALMQNTTDFKPSGKNYIRNKVHSSCLIRSDGTWFWHAQKLSGKSPISFLVKVYGYTPNDAIKHIQTLLVSNRDIYLTDD